MHNVKRDIVIWEVCLTLLHFLAIGSSAFRLYRRTKIAQIWWDDYIAAFALAFDLIYFPTLWFPANALDIDRITNPRGVQLAIASSWLTETAFVLLIWSTRISIGLSIARVMPPKSRYYYASLWLVYTLAATALAIITVYMVECGQSYSIWSKSPPYLCYPGLRIESSISAIDVLSDLLLVVVPIWAFCKQVKLSDTSRRVIKLGFCANMMAGLASLCSAIILLGEGEKFGEDILLIARIALHTMAAVSLLSCSSLVVITSFYRAFKSKDNDKARVKELHPPPFYPRSAIFTQHMTPQDRQASTTNTSKINTSSCASGPNLNTALNRDGWTTQLSSQIILTDVETDPSLFLSQYRPYPSRADDIA